MYLLESDLAIHLKEFWITISYKDNDLDASYSTWRCKFERPKSFTFNRI